MSDVTDWNATILEEFRANRGVVGGVFDGAPLLLLRTSGAKSGADTHPDWYLNLEKNPEVLAELGTGTFAARAEALPEAKTTRVIPVVELIRER